MKLDRATDSYCKKVATRVTERRKAAGLSINRLSEMAGISQSMMSYIEQGRSIPTIGTLYRIAKALETSPDELLGGI